MRFRTARFAAQATSWLALSISRPLLRGPESAPAITRHVSKLQYASETANNDSAPDEKPKPEQATEVNGTLQLYSLRSYAWKSLCEETPLDLKCENPARSVLDYSELPGDDNLGAASVPVYSSYVGYSYTYLKRLRPPPYITLYNAILKASPEVAKQYRSPDASMDLSFRNPDLPGFGTKVQLSQADCYTWKNGILDRLPTLWSIMAKVLGARPSHADSGISEDERQQLSSLSLDDPFLYAEGAGMTDVQNTLNAFELAYLDRTGYSVESLDTWAEFILEPDTDQAVYKLNQHIFSDTTDKMLTPTNYVPLMVIMLLLKRQSISGHALQMLLNCIWHILRAAPAWVSFEDRQIFILFIRLVRHATKVLPSVLPNITAILTTFTAKGGDWNRISLTKLYNSALSALAYASGENPFRAWSFQANAQFMLVSHMVQHNPPLDISSKGYAALVQAQLKHQKTPQEEEWARLQSRGWPPYPKPRTAMDEDKGFEFAASRAMKTIQYMRQAGYHYPLWEKVASIYAGWDSDGTPTIRTRDAWLPQVASEDDAQWELRAVAARIRTTRDIREAWAQFLRYEESKLPFSDKVYWAMFSRIHQEKERIEGRQTVSNREMSPGDMKEILAPATSPMQKVFLTSEPPSFMEFFAHMTRRTDSASPSFLSALMAYSPSIEDGITIWVALTRDAEAKSLISELTTENSSSLGTTQSWRIFRGFIELLCRFPGDQSAVKLFDNRERQQMHRVLQDIFRSTGTFWWVSKSCSMAVIQALYLLRTTQPPIQLLYTRLLEGLIKAQYDVKIPNRPPTFWFFPAVLEVLSLVKKSAVTPEAALFDNLCHFMELGGRSARKVLNMTAAEKFSQHMQHLQESASSFMAVGSTVLRRTFAAIYKPALEPSRLEAATRGLENVPPIPHTLTAPTPMIAHRYIRALAMFHDHEGIYSFVRWCSEHREALLEICSHVPQGQEHWNYTLAAFRVALEQPEHMFWNLPIDPRRRAPEDLILLVRQTLEDMGELGRWVDDSEVEDYKLHRKLQAAIRTHDWAMKNTH